MEVTDFTHQDGRSSLQIIRRVLARAVTEARGNVAKVNWLDAVIGETIIVVTADGNLNFSDFTSDQASNLSVPSLLHKLIKATSESSTYGGDYKAQLLSDLNVASTILTA